MITEDSSRLFCGLLILVIFLTVRYSIVKEETIVVGVFPFFRKKIDLDDVFKAVDCTGRAFGGVNNLKIYTQNKVYRVYWENKKQIDAVKELLKKKGIEIK